MVTTGHAWARRDVGLGLRSITKGTTPLWMAIVLCALGCGQEKSKLCEIPPAPVFVPPPGSIIDYLICDVTATTEVSIDSARGMGFLVDRDLALLGRTNEASFHRGNFACGGVASSDGRVSIATQVQALVVMHQGPTSHAPPMTTCPPDFLVYRTMLDLRTDDGAVAGSFSIELSSDPFGLDGATSVDVRRLAGNLRVRADLTRSHAARMNFTTTIREDGMSGQLFTLVSYADQTGDYDDGEFWPADAPDSLCNWLQAPATPNSRVVSLDAYNATCTAAGEGAPTF